MWIIRNIEQFDNWNLSKFKQLSKCVFVSFGSLVLQKSTENEHWGHKLTAEKHRRYFELKNIDIASIEKLMYTEFIKQTCSLNG